MRKVRFIFIKIKTIILPFCICFFTLSLIVFSKNNLSATKSGIVLWANSVLPSLLPFFIATELLGYTNIVPFIGRLLNNIMRPLFNVPGEGAFALIMGIISGYPVGAKIVANLKEQGVCSEIECERLIAFTNNSGPLFIIGTVGIGLFFDAKIGILLFISHLLACLTVGIIFRWWKIKQENYCFYTSNKFELSSRILLPRSSNINSETICFSNLGEILSKSIMSAINSVMTIGGFVVLFSVIISILKSSQILFLITKFLNPIFNLVGIPNIYCEGIITGIIEVTNGLQYISSVNTSYSYIQFFICSFLLGFGGLSILLQVLSITSKAHISIKPYFLGKILQAIFSCIYIKLLLH